MPKLTMEEGLQKIDALLIEIDSQPSILYLPLLKTMYERSKDLWEMRLAEDTDLEIEGLMEKFQKDLMNGQPIRSH